MSTFSQIRSRSGSRDGVALIMVLAFIVLTTILIVSFIAFTKLNRVATASYSKSIQAQEIAQGGIQDIMGDIRNEIVAGSICYTNTAPSVYLPITNYTAAPARLGYLATQWGTAVGTSASQNLAPTLIRVSRGDPLNPAPSTVLYPVLNTLYYTNMAAVGGAILNRASVANTTAPSVNGRSVSAVRWNKSYMLNFRTSSIPTIFSQTAAAPNGPPDWVYVTRTGSRVCNAATEMASLKPSNSVNTVYTINAGSNPPPSPVVGRYAFIMYDEGATVDINSAGVSTSAIGGGGNPPTYTSSVTPPIYTDPTTQVITTATGKSYLANADLTQLGNGLTQANVDTILNYRSAGSIANVTTGGNAYLGAVFNLAQTGFLSGTNNGTAYDSPFVGRQDLINYFLQNLSAVGQMQALPSLGVFSRSINSPSWYPQADATTLGASSNGTGNVYAYHSNADTVTVNGNSNPNLDMANIRWPTTMAATLVTHYSDTGATSTYNVYPGQPMLQNRFSLAKINLLSQADPVAGTAPTSTAAIQACFGLVWDYPGGSASTTANGGNKCWNYCGPATGSTPTAGSVASSSTGMTIETLAQVAAESTPREPNFFELLKAAILSGSLGLDAGQAGYYNGTDSPHSFQASPWNPGGTGGQTVGQLGVSGLYAHTFGPLTTARAPAQIPDIQIIKIGADIIDQFDADSYPTAIYFRYLNGTTETAFDPVNGSALNPPIFGPVDMVYGEENLPLIERLTSGWCTTAGNGTTGASGGPTGTAGYTDYANTSAMGSFYHMQIWNPHQLPGSTLSNVPQKFQIRAYGSAVSSWGQDGGMDAAWTNHFTATGYTNYNDTSPVVNYYQGTGNSETCDAGTINITDANGGTGTSALYTNPVLLSQDQIPGVTISSPDSTNMAPSSGGSGYCYPYYSKDHFVAFCTGISTKWYVDKPSDGVTNLSPSGGNTNTFVLGWLNGTSFHPYCYITGAFTFDYMVVNNGQSSYVGSCLPQDVTPYPWYAPDPRTGRFATVSNIFGSVPSVNNTIQGQTLYPSYTANSSHRAYEAQDYMPYGSHFFPVAVAGSTGGYPSDWMVNSSTANTTAGQVSGSSPYNYYSDPDGVIRPGDAIYGNASTGDGMMLYTSAGTGGAAAGDATSLPTLGGDATGNSSHGRRPVILNRPFRSVGELGYVFRDLPFKTLDFFSQYSADAALLDVFSITDESRISNHALDPVTAGQIDPNNASVAVLTSILSLGSKKDLDTTYYMSSGDATAIAGQIATQLKPTNTSAGGGPLINRSNIATSLTTAIQQGYTHSYDGANKAYLEAPVRAMADVTNTRTWNLMIDIIAQSGHMSPTAATLNDFVVEGEKRYWLHIAIDRYTGKIIDQQLEPVYE